MIKKIKKVLIYIILLIVIIKCGKIVFKNETEETASVLEEETNVDYKEFDYGDYTTIKLLHTDTRRG